MSRIRLCGWHDDEKTEICAENRREASHGTISAKYISKAKIKEMEEYGYCFVNQRSERVI